MQELSEIEIADLEREIGGKAADPQQQAYYRKIERWRMKSNGAQPARTRTFYRVETTKIEIPEWARVFGVPGLDRHPKLIWLGMDRKRPNGGRGTRYIANLIRDLDHAANGDPTITAHEVYQCPTCGRWAIGPEAKLLLNRVEIHRTAKTMNIEPGPVICGVDCSGNEQGEELAGKELRKAIKVA